MRLATLSFSLVTLFAATVLAQEIIAPVEWFDHHHHHKSNSNHKNNKTVNLSGSGLPRLEKRRWGYPSRLDIEHRATEFNSFRSDEIVAAPANLHILQEPWLDLKSPRWRWKRLSRTLTSNTAYGSKDAQTRRQTDS
ncbi:hypothetical protein BKA57DRAFT_471074 [Linnemannia elongata]|nr:hypothetical protein BKA57DRAFT_471074 [Linnemannia elongata]